jgi:PPOX class probable F420-dependent enzyme
MREEAKEGRPARGLQPRAGLSTRAAPTLDPFVHQRYVLLTTYRRDGTPVGTPVNIAVDGDRAFVRTWDTTWKLKRIRNNPEVEVAPSTIRGKPTGPALHARARILEGDESTYAGRAIARKHRILHGFLVPLVHRLRRNKTVHIELTPVDY